MKDVILLIYYLRKQTKLVKLYIKRNSPLYHLGKITILEDKVVLSNKSQKNSTKT